MVYIIHHIGRGVKPSRGKKRCPALAIALSLLGPAALSRAAVMTGGQAAVEATVADEGGQAALAGGTGRVAGSAGQPGGFIRMSAGTAVLDSGFPATGRPPVILRQAWTNTGGGAVLQGETTGFFKVRLWADRTGRRGDQLTWTSLRVRRIGTAGAAMVNSARVYQDNGNEVFSLAEDALVSGAQVFTGDLANVPLSGAGQLITSTTQTYFIALGLSQEGLQGASATLGVEIATGAFTVTSGAVDRTPLPAASALSTVNDAGDVVSAASANLAPATVSPGQANVGMLRLDLWTNRDYAAWNQIRVERTDTALDADVPTVYVYKDNGNLSFDGADTSLGSASFASGVATVTLTTSQLLNPTTQVYFVSADVAAGAVAGRNAALRISNATTNFILAGAADQASLASAILSGTFSIQTVSNILYTAGTGLAPADVYQGGSDVPFLRLGLRTSQGSSALNGLKVDKAGTTADSSVSAVRLYRDLNGDGIFQSTDTFVAQGPFAAGSIQFSSLGQSLSQTTAYFFLTVNLDPAATVGSTLGLTIAGAASLAAGSGTTVSAFPAIESILATIKDTRTPTTPKVAPDAPFIATRTRVHFVWSSTMTAAGAITQAQYAIGTSPGATDVVAWTVVSGNQTDILATGLNLQLDTYYVTVKALSDTGFTSDPGSSFGIRVDALPPQMSGSVSSLVEEGGALLSWTAATPGISGVLGYVVESRPAESPHWRNVRSGALATLSAAGELASAGAGSLSPSAQFSGQSSELVTGTSYVTASLSDGSYYYRTWAVSGAKVVSSQPIYSGRVVVGALPGASLSNAHSYPNPFDSRVTHATLVYTLNQTSDVKIQLFNLFGGKIREMTFPAGSPSASAGTNEAVWDGTDDSGGKVSKGMYLAVIQAGGSKQVLKIGVAH